MNPSPVRFPEDLALVRGCATGAAAALAAFERTIMPKAVAAANGLLDSSLSAQELAQALRVHLFVPQSDAPPRIAGYNGSVPLSAWIRVIARRCALNLKDSTPHWVEHSGIGSDERVLCGTPEQDLARQRFRQCFNVAFAAAVKSLLPRDRSILRQHYCDGVSQDNIARSYGVHRCTVVRWIATTRAILIQRTRESVARTLGPSSTDLDSLLRGAFSNIELNISAVFSDASVAS